MKKFDLTNLVVRITTLFARLALLNLCWLLFSLPIITLIPATDTVFECLNRWELEGHSGSVFQEFKAIFKERFKKSYKWGIPFLIVLLIIVVDIYFLNQATISSPVFQVLKYAFYTFSFLLILAILYTIPLMKRTRNTHVRMLLVGLMMAVLHPLVTLAVLAGIIILVIIFFIWPSMLFFVSMSGIAWILTKAVDYIYNKELKNN